MWRSTQALRSAYMAYFQLPWLPEATLRPALRSMLTRSGLGPEHADRYAHAMAGDALTAALNWYRALPWTPGRAFAPVTVPTTYVWGRRDLALGRAAAHSTARCVAAPYRFVELDAGHWLPENNPGSGGAGHPGPRARHRLRRSEHPRGPHHEPSERDIPAAPLWQGGRVSWRDFLDGVDAAESWVAGQSFWVQVPLLLVVLLPGRVAPRGPDRPHRRDRILGRTPGVR